mmetsp:Transcript_23453/g.41497  ORF Transcript_23453/g.41497 Transcript_23453/m.41497 type:complete len:705 (+) Transcript_23453:52-2166(+)|eukprot:CAMPEP_0197522322 /NCGR_PEP_ID=MMETSP1318-20131121/7488_1 /TAXON_ID=552666 /ORGANISM="Partenskyella glossopodia, Strain RCC365" /LENGTH=704 /DNA_ID=CAMNT_0043074663 /DNA_START=36 /DNA_END=2150 /DNA_ORIENTATION=-
MSAVAIDESEIVVVVMDYLKRKGFVESLVALEKESKVSMESYGKEITYLRRLMLDGQWEDLENIILPLKDEAADFDFERIQFLIHRQKFLEMLYSQSLSSAVVELVENLKQFEGKCSGQEFQQLCYCVTLPKLTDHPDFRYWTPHKGRSQCFDEVLPLLQRVYTKYNPDGKPASVAQIEVMEPNRLVTLLRQAVLYQVDNVLRHSDVKSAPQRLTLSLFKNFEIDTKHTPQTYPSNHLSTHHNPNPSPNPNLNNTGIATGIGMHNGHYPETVGAPQRQYPLASPLPHADKHVHHHPEHATPEVHGAEQRRRNACGEFDEQVKNEQVNEGVESMREKKTPLSHENKKKKKKKPELSKTQQQQQQQQQQQRPRQMQMQRDDSIFLESNALCHASHKTQDLYCIGTTSGSLLILNTEGPMRTLFKRPLLHTNGVTSLDWCTQNPRLLASGGRDKEVCVNVHSEHLLAAEREQDSRNSAWQRLVVGQLSSSATCVKFRAKSPHIISADADKWIHIWECTRAVGVALSKDLGKYIHLEDRCLGSFKHGDSVTSLSLCSQNHNILASSSLDKSVALWDLTSNSATSRYDCEDEVLKVEISSDGRQVVYGCREGKVCLLDLRNGKILWHRRTQGFRDLAWAPNERNLLSVTNNAIEMIDAASGRSVCKMKSDFERSPAALVTWRNCGSSRARFMSACGDVVQSWRATECYL